MAEDWFDRFHFFFLISKQTILKTFFLKKQNFLPSLFAHAFLKNVFKCWGQKHLMLCPSISYVETHKHEILHAIIFLISWCLKAL